MPPGTSPSSPSAGPWPLWQHPAYPEPGNPDFSAKAPFWDSFVWHLQAGPGLLAGFGGATLILLLLISRWRHGEKTQFRLTAGLLAQIPNLLLVYFGSALIMLCMIATQLAFTTVIMPAPGPAARPIQGRDPEVRSPAGEVRT